jgi:PAS domain S-box-containing protein
MSTILFLEQNNTGLTAQACDLAASLAPSDAKLISAFCSSEKGKSTLARPLSQVIDQQFDLAIWISADKNSLPPLLPGSPVIVHWQLSPDSSSDSVSLGDKVQSFFRDGYFSALLNHQRNFKAIMGSLPIGVIAHDLQRKIVYFSPQAEKITGFSAGEVVGRDCHTIFTPSLCGEQCSFCDGAPRKTASQGRYSTSFLTKQGERREMEMSVVPLLDETNMHIGILASFQDQTRLHRLEREVEATAQFSGIIGQDHQMQLIYDLVRDLSQCDFPVVITGESGTGKELIAHAVHAESARKNNLFVPINCGALPEGTLESELFGHVKGAFTGAIRDKKGRFELADKGTLFLDEVAELSPSMQVKLLRVLQEGTFEPVGGEHTAKVDVRVISATNKNLKELVRKGTFREDLYYRLAVVPIEVPPLRERRNDIALLADHFLEKFAGRLGKTNMRFADPVRSIFMTYQWPGNVRQLQNAIQFSLIKCRGQSIEPEHLPPEITASMVLPTQTPPDLAGKVGRKPKLSEETVAVALRRTAGNKAKAARMLGVGRATLYNFLTENPHLAKYQDG